MLRCHKGPPKHLIQFENRCGKDPNMRGFVSDLYTSLINMMSSGPPPYMAKWMACLLHMLPEHFFPGKFLQTALCGI